MLRINVGLEDPRDLIEDMDRALAGRGSSAPSEGDCPTIRRTEP